MKRSDMVKLMWDFIQEIENEHEVYMREPDVENLLSRMEEAGMQPPSSQLDQNNWGISHGSCWDEDRKSTQAELNESDFEQLVEQFPELIDYAYLGRRVPSRGLK